MADILDVLPSAAENWSQAAQFLEQSVRAGCKDAEAHYLLAMCYKHLGRAGDARAALARIAQADANVLLQRGLLAYTDKDFAQAERDFAESWAADPGSYAAGYNLFLAQLCQGKRVQAADTIARLLPLAPTAAEGRFLGLLQSLFRGERPGQQPTAELRDTVLAMSVDDEARLIELLGGLGQFEVVFPLLEWLVQGRPHSNLVFQAYFQAALLQAKDLLDRAMWEDAYSLLANLTRRPAPRDAKMDPQALVALYSMLGACACFLQDFEHGIGFFHTAQEHHNADASARHPPLSPQGVPQQAWLEQNLALAHEWQGKLDRAEAHWNRYFDALEAAFAHSRPADHLPLVAFAGLTRLADLYTRKEKWQLALGFLQRAHKIRSGDNATLEQMFHVYNQLRKPEEARRILRRLRDVRPNDPQVELFELDVRELRDLDDLDRLLADARRILQKYPGNLHVEERGGAMIANLLPFMDKIADQLTGQANKVVDQMRRLPSYQINWPVVREIMREQEDKFYQLRRAAHKSLALVTGDTRSQLQRIISLCDRKIEQCHTLGE